MSEKEKKANKDLEQQITKLIHDSQEHAASHNQYVSLKHLFQELIENEKTDLHQIIREQNIDLTELVKKIHEVDSSGYDEALSSTTSINLLRAIRKTIAESPVQSLSLLFVQMVDGFITNDQFASVAKKEAMDIKQVLAEFGLNQDRFDQLIAKRIESDSGDKEGEELERIIQERSGELNKRGLNLTEIAKEDPNFGKIYGREDELKSMMFALSKMRSNNVLLIGQPGVGKTELVRALAAKIVRNEVPDHLQGIRLIELQANQLLAGASLLGEIERRVESIVKELTNSDDLVLFMDEIHQIMKSDISSAHNVSDVLKSVLDVGRPIIGATTFDEYNAHMKDDLPFLRRFVEIKVEEMPREDIIKTIETALPVYEEFHRVCLDRKHIPQIINISDNYFPNLKAPANVLAVLDTLFAMERCSPPEQFKQASELDKKIVELATQLEEIEAKTEKEEADYKVMAETKATCKQLEEKRDKLDIGDGRIPADPRVAIKVASNITGIPQDSIGSHLLNKLVGLDDYLKERVVGQDKIVGEVATAIIRSTLNINIRRGPKNVFLFLGPTGVGKTYLCQNLNKFIFSKDDKMIRLDMSEFQDATSLNRLLGSAPGYVGYDRGGRLTNFVSNNPHCVILLDEIEKAHTDILQAFLQVFDEGRMTDGRGREVDFTHAIVVMTSNLGSDVIMQDRDHGFQGVAQSDDGRDERNQKRIAELLEDKGSGFSPEFLNRIDDVLVFRTLSDKDVSTIAELQLQVLKDSFRKHDITLDIGDKVVEQIVKEGDNVKYGARNINRTITRLISNPLATALSRKVCKGGDTVRAVVKDGKVCLD